MKRIIRLTEGDLRRIVKRSANRILREFGSDGSDFDEPYGTSNMFQNIGMNGQHAESASDIDDFNPDDMGIYDGNESDEDDDMYFDDDDLDFYDGEGGRLSDGYYNEYDDDNQPDMIVPESRRRISRIIKESIRKVLKEASVYPGYDSTTTADIAGDGGGNIDGGNIITCYGSPSIINGKYQGSGAGTILGPGVIYLSCNPPSREMARMYGQLVPVKVDVSNFYRAKDAWEAKKLIGLVGFKDEYSGVLYRGNRDGDVCAVFDRSCIIG